MGMRIHRAVGWATTHAQSSALGERLYEEGVDGEVEAFVKRSNLKNAFLELPMGKLAYPLRFSNLMHQVCGPDFKENDWIISTPAFAMKWFRHDDMIDWAAVRHGPNWQENTIVELPEQPYPYDRREGVPPIVLALAQKFGFDAGQLVPALATWWS